MCKTDKLLIRIIGFECAKRHLQYHGLIRLSGHDGMNLIGIHDHKFSGGKNRLFFINIEFQISVKHRKDLNRPVPVFIPEIIPVFALK